MQILGFVNRVQDVEATVDLDKFTMAEVESNAVRCPDTDAAERMYDGEALSMRQRLRVSLGMLGLDSSWKI